MDEWDSVNAEVPKGSKQYKHLSQSTRSGLQVTISATLRLFQFLVEIKHNFKYLMTDRLNQDALEVSSATKKL